MGIGLIPNNMILFLYNELKFKFNLFRVFKIKKNNSKIKNKSIKNNKYNLTQKKKKQNKILEFELFFY